MQILGRIVAALVLLDAGFVIGMWLSRRLLCARGGIVMYPTLASRNSQPTNRRRTRHDYLAQHIVSWNPN